MLTKKSRLVDFTSHRQPLDVDTCSRKRCSLCYDESYLYRISIKSCTRCALYLCESVWPLCLCLCVCMWGGGIFKSYSKHLYVSFFSAGNPSSVSAWVFIDVYVLFGTISLYSVWGVILWCIRRKINISLEYGVRFRGGVCKENV